MAGESPLALADWAIRLAPSTEDGALARRSLIDTLAVAAAARRSPIVPVARHLGFAAGTAALAHYLDFDDLHLPSTAHISSVCVSASLGAGGNAKAFLAGAGVMARIGSALGWRHYSRGWHATCTAGAPAAAVAASIAMGLTVDETAHAIALSLPSAGGLQAVFGSQGKSLQVGFAVQAGLRSAELASLGARSDLRSFDAWLELLGGSSGAVCIEGPTIPGGLAIKMYPCCYALQRPIDVASALVRKGARATDIEKIVVEAPRSTLQPLIHDRPTSGLEAKFSLPFAIAVTIADEGKVDFAAFTDSATRRPDVEELRQRVLVVPSEGGEGLLEGKTRITLHQRNRAPLTVALGAPSGSPEKPLSDHQLRQKVHLCDSELADQILNATWSSASSILDSVLDSGSP